MPPATALDDLTRPPCAELLGWEVLDARPDEGWIRIGFQGRPEFRNPAGFIQGGLLAAMLDDTMGPAAFIMGRGAIFTPTIDLQVTFLAPARVGRLIGEGRVVQIGKTIAFLEASLTDEAGTLVARATASARVVPAEQALVS